VTCANREARTAKCEERMMQGQNIVRMLLFIVFFLVGATALSISVLCDDLIQYYRNKQALQAAEQSLERLRNLNTAYDTLLRQLEEDPNVLKRLGPAALGIEPEDPNTVYPKATLEELAAARRALEDRSKATMQTAENRRMVDPNMPAWLTRCSQRRRRIMLFLAGAGLVLISLICFGSRLEQPRPL